MYIPNTFEEEWQSVKNEFHNGSFIYADTSVPVREVITSHFMYIKHPHTHGVYVIRSQNTQEVFCIGKAGTIRNNGEFGMQDIPKRLKNVRNNDMPADEWFRNLVNEKGPLIIEFVFLEKTPTSPAFIETLLLQAYLNNYGHLPYRNKTL